MYVIKEVPDDTAVKDENIKQIFTLQQKNGKRVKIGTSVSVLDSHDFGNMIGTIDALASHMVNGMWDMIEITNCDERLEITKGDTKKWAN